MSRTTKGNKIDAPYTITPAQALGLNASTIIGVGVLSLPRSTADSAEHLAWLSVVIGLMIAFLSVVIIYKLGQRFPDKTIVGYSRVILGSKRNKWVGNILSFPVVMLYVVYWSVVTAMVVRIFGEVVVSAVLTNTPLEVTVSSMLILCFFMVIYDVELVARVNEVLLPIIVFPVLIISLLAYQKARFEYIMPILPSPSDWKGVSFGIVPALTSLLGFDVMTMFNSHLKREKKILRYQAFGVAIPGVLYTLIVIAGIMAFGFEELAKQAWPTLELVKSVKAPGLILERLEAIFLGVWVAAVFTTAGNWNFCAVWSFSQLFRIRNHKWTALVLGVALYFIAMRPRNIKQLFMVLDWVGYFGLVIACLLPLCLLLIAMIRKLDERETDKPQEVQDRAAG
ncbi:endospore germination permease [Tumebacillus sp. ITR2]|uniref:Endospore germination permease n=1 Tax=Tumebacillus amylolyticus TaxID=2801339 RepID=A0ABS1JFQ6_9BACL|nr:endospore germination permease [Tumebacillus amylolyticus]MBL0389106.1 endospore germination permease [Tumebacillus amylolyticus]